MHTTNLQVREIIARDVCCIEAVVHQPLIKSKKGLATGDGESA